MDDFWFSLGYTDIYGEKIKDRIGDNGILGCGIIMKINISGISYTLRTRSHGPSSSLIYLLKTICNPWCWNMNPNICPCPKSPSFVGKYTIHGAYGKVGGWFTREYMGWLRHPVSLDKDVSARLAANAEAQSGWCVDRWVKSLVSNGILK